MRIKIVLFLAIFLLMVSGCSKKNPKPGANVSDANSLTGETVTIDEGGVSSQNRYNGSSSGMKSIYFDFGGYDVSFSEQSTIAFNANVLRQKLQGKRVKLEGNCDEFGTDEYNYALGLKRARAVKESLVAQGISAGKIVLVSYGESNPRCHELSDSCYDQNRRVDLHLVK